MNANSETLMRTNEEARIKNCEWGNKTEWLLVWEWQIFMGKKFEEELLQPVSCHLPKVTCCVLLTP